MTQIFFSWDFFIHRMTRNLFGDFLLRRLLTDFRRCDLSGRCRYPLRVENFPQILFSWDFFSSDDTEFIRRFPAETITHGFSRMRPVRSLQIPPESGKFPTDFTDIRRFFLMGFFSSDATEFIRRFPAETITYGFSRRRPVRSLQIPP